MIEEHVESYCAVCEITFKDAETLQTHYDSSAHPHCSACNAGFADCGKLNEVRVSLWHAHYDYL